MGIGQNLQFKEHLNKYDVIHIDVQWFRVCAGTAMESISLIQQEIVRELRAEEYILVTNNAREFNRVEELTVEDWTIE